MAVISIPWTTGGGSLHLDYIGQGDGVVLVTSDANTSDTARTQVLTIATTSGTPAVSVQVTVGQAAGAHDVLILAMTPIITEDAAFVLRTESGDTMTTEESGGGEILLTDGDTINVS